MSTYPDNASLYREQQAGIHEREVAAASHERFNEPQFFGIDNETFVQMVRRKARDEFPDIRIAMYQCATMIEDQQSEIRQLRGLVAEMEARP